MEKLLFIAHLFIKTVVLMIISPFIVLTLAIGLARTDYDMKFNSSKENEQPKQTVVDYMP